MADKKISELVAITSLLDNDETVIARSGQSVKITPANAVKYYGIKIQLTSVGYVPSATNNPDYNKVAPGSDGFWYLFDAIGSAIKILDLLSGQTIVEDKNYVHIQGSASSTWNITHNLGKFPAMQAEDSGGTLIPIVNIQHVDINNAVMTLAYSTSGKVICN